ncbi:hypothetical protein DYI23_15860 [Roseibium polysiphoniae]|uniref:Uncharacterized protein n=1 Tax=Roseibium polysiphoniae TaxID=2571221 RepID=A0A944CF58_9HYPH|nr:hypothetical protein [Roseibium polysiphoniae]MBS8261703.1 hypothetical protein [Roseibium polysiphoniae]
MPEFRLPLSGDVTQAINPWFDMFKAFGSQFGLININLGRSPAPEIEQKVLQEVGSYGRQLGRMGDALNVLVEKLEPKLGDLTKEERLALDAFRVMQAEIDQIKSDHRLSR